MEIILFIIGFLFSAFGGLILWDSFAFRKTAQETTGRVIGYSVKKSASRKSGTQQSYAPVIEYHARGEVHQFTARLSSTHISHKIGDTVLVLISPHEKNKARLKGPGMIIIGSIFFVIGVVAMVTFFFIFQVSTFSIGAAGFVIIVLLFNVGRSLHRNNIHSIDDIKDAIDKIKEMKSLSSSPQTDDQERIITDPTQFEQVKKRTKAPVWVLGLFLLIGVGACVGGVYLTIERSNFLDVAVTAEGIVTGFKSRTSTSDGTTTTTYYPLVKYTSNGHTDPVSFESDWGSNPPSYSHGDQVKVLYLPTNPKEAIIDTGWMNWMGPIITLTVGSVFILLGGGLLLQRLRNKAKQAKVELVV